LKREGLGVSVSIVLAPSGQLPIAYYE
jgi:hypothetical protein